MFCPETKKELQDAVNLWCKNQSKALEKYGDINTWDVSKITDMSELFKDIINFNNDISSWNMSNVNHICFQEHIFLIGIFQSGMYLM